MPIPALQMRSWMLTAFDLFLNFASISILFSFCQALFFSVSLAATRPVMTLRMALQKAFEASPEYITAQNQLEIARLEAKNTFATFFPSLDLTASHGIQETDPRVTTTTTKQTHWVSGTSLVLTENFYDNGESYKKNQIAQNRFNVATLNHDKIKAQIIRKVVLAYYRYNISTQNLRFIQKNYEELERLAKLVSNQFYQGMKTKRDFLSFKTRAQRSRLDVIEAEKQWVAAKAQMLALIGINPDDDVFLDETVKPYIPKKNLETKFAETELYEYRTLNIQKEISEIELGLAKRRYWPELNLVGTASYGSSSYVNTRQTWNDNDTSGWSIFLNLKFNLLDWGIRSRNIRIARLTQTSAEQAVRDSLLQVQKELELFKLEVERSEESYRLSKELQKMEEDTFKLLERDYKAGQTTYLELTTSLANLLDAQARGLEADYNQADLYLRWKYYKGILNEETVFQ